MKKYSILLIIFLLFITFSVYNYINKKNSIKFCMETKIEEEIINCTESPYLNLMTNAEYFKFLMLHKDFKFKKDNNEKLFFIQLSFAYGNCSNQENCKKENQEIIKKYQDEN